MNGLQFSQHPRTAVGALRPWLVVGVVAGLFLALPFGPWSPADRPLGGTGDGATSKLALHGSPAPIWGVRSLASPVRPIGPLSGTPALRWINVTSSGKGTAPPVSASSAMAYDPVDQETVLFGGCGSAQCPDNQTWVFANGTWTNITNPRDAPPARYGASMDFDANMGGVLLFGGGGPGSVYFNDTWLFQAGAWTNLSRVSGVAPPARVYATMAFDPQPEENGSVLFGGYEPSLGPGYGNDTWVWEGWAGWVLLDTSVSPPVSDLAQMAYDPAEQAIVLFGCGDGCIDANQTWELYSGQWWQVSPPGSIPPYRYGAAMIYDPALSGVLMFGGYGFSGAMNDSWVFSNGAWSTVSFGPAPAGRYVASISPGGGNEPVLLFGGSQFYPFGIPLFNDTWVLEVPPVATLTAAPSPVETTAVVTVTATIANGTAPFRALFEFGDGGSDLVQSSSSSIVVTHSYIDPGTYFPSVNVTDSGGVHFRTAAALGVHVVAGPSLGPVKAPGPGDVGIPLSFSASTVTGGTGPFTFFWQFGDGANATGASAKHAYSSAGTYSGNLTVTDALSVSSTQAFSVVVHPLPALTLGAAPIHPTAGTNVTFYGNVSGGTPPYTYAWRFGDGASASFRTPTHDYSTAGTYTAELWANDSLGATSHATFGITVAAGPSPSPTPTPSPTNSSSSGSIPSWFWPGVAGLVVAGGVGAFVLLRRGRPPGA